MGLNVTGSPALASVLRAHREGLGMTQNELANDVGIHTSTVWKIEAGKRGIGLAALNALAARLGPDFKREAEAAMGHTRNGH